MSAKTLNKQTAKFIARLSESLPDLPSDTMQIWIDDPKELQRFLSGLNLPDIYVHVDRTINISSDLMKKMILDEGFTGYTEYFLWKTLHPEIELEYPEPSDFSLWRVGLWLHDKQKTGNITGLEIYEYLKDSHMLKDCLNLLDGLAIQQKGIVIFRKFFKDKMVFLWRSVMRSKDGGLFVPGLCEYNDNIVLRWIPLFTNFNLNEPALFFS